MNKSIITIFSALMLVFSLSLVSAASSASVSWNVGTSTIFQEQSKTLVANITNDGTVNESLAVTMDLTGLGLTSFSQNVASLAPGASTSISVPINTTSNTDIGAHTLTLSVYAQNTSLSTDNFTITSAQTLTVLYPFCENVSNMTGSPINLYDIKNRADIDGEDFNPLDEYELSVKVRNNDDEDSQKAVIEMVLVQANGEVDDTLVDDSQKISDTDYFTFKLNSSIPADIEEGKAYLYVRVYNDDDENNCEQDVLEMNIEKRSKELAPTELEFPKTVSCGETFTFSGRIANIGDSDEDKVNVVLTTLGQTFSEEFDNLDSGDYSPVFDFSVKVPTNLTEGTAKFSLRTEYDYDDEDETYGDSDSYSYLFTVANCKVDLASFKTETSTALTNTASEVRFLISNPSSYTQTFAVSATADWATISSVTPQTVTLEAGKQQYVSVALTPNKNAEVGIHNVAAKISYGSTTESLSLPVTVQSASASLGMLDKVGYQFKYNTMWAVTDVVLVIAIIVLLVMIFAGKRK